MVIRYEFNLDKAIAAMVYLVHRAGSIGKVKLMKLLYLADRDHFLRHGAPITGDDQYAMPHGPVPSASLNALNGDVRGAERVFKFLHVDDYTVMAKAPLSSIDLTDDETATLDEVFDQYGAITTWALVDLTHELPEYVDVSVPGSSTPIPYELILKHHGSDQQYSKNRAVISPRMAAYLTSPFDQSEPDL